MYKDGKVAASGKDFKTGIFFPSATIAVDLTEKCEYYD